MNQQDPNQPFQPTQYDPQPFQPPAHQKPKKKRTGLKVLGAVVGVFVVIGVASSLGGNDSSTPQSTLPNAVTTTTAPPATKPAAPATTQAPKPSMTKSQEQAVGSARRYLEYSSFSRKGLIRQLSSSAGEGFSTADATFAVDHLKVNWNEQAAKSAKKYLEYSNFSRKGLIRQLESSAGEGFTHAQAVYGVDKAGL